MTRGRAIDVCTNEQTPNMAGLYTWRTVGKEIVVLSIIIALLVLWLLGVVTSNTLGGVIHILLVVAMVVVLLRVIQGRNPLRG
jgi:formate hydrogenlyase subunit 4